MCQNLCDVITSREYRDISQARCIGIVSILASLVFGSVSVISGFSDHALALIALWVASAARSAKFDASFVAFQRTESATE